MSPNFSLPDAQKEEYQMSTSDDATKIPGIVSKASANPGTHPLVAVHAHLKPAAGKGSHSASGQYMSTFALAMMIVSALAGLANDVQQSFYGLSSITFFTIGAIVFFVPTALVSAELASGWPERGGIFRWVGEGIGKGWAFTMLMILWFQCSINFGIAIPSSTADIMFYTPHFKQAVAFAQHPSYELPIMLCWLAFYWLLAWLATKGLKAFSSIAKFGVIIGSIIPLGLMVVLAIVWVAQGHTPNISFAPRNLIPKWQGISTLALAAGVFFSYAGIDMNAAHIKQLKNPKKQFPKAILISMILTLLIFMVGTIIIAMVIPNKQINVLYTLFATFRVLGATIGMPWLYMVLTWALLCNIIAMTITNFAGPSFMLGQAARSGFLPKWMQSNNKHGMPSKLMYLQCGFMTVFAFLVELLPNVEGFVVMLTQALTVLYLIYYVVMFVAFIRLKYDQPNRPRSFTVPGGKAGAWLTAVSGIVSSIFGIVLAIWPPAQVASEVGSPVTYVVTIIAIVVVIFAICLVVYRMSRTHNWVDPSNKFAPFTWEIEGMSKPGRALSDVPTDVLSAGQDPMGLPIKHAFDRDAKLADLRKVGNLAGRSDLSNM